ncbi:MAG: TolC family protein [bacterium]|nr:TolC family protein [bacterium]
MKKLFLLSVFFFTIATNSNAQETIDLNTAIDIALSNNTSIINLQRSIDIQRLSVSTAKGSLFPTLSLSTSWNRNNTFSNGTTRFQNGVPIVIPQQNTWLNNFNVGINSQVTLFDGFSNYEQVTLEEQNQNLARIQYEREKYDVVFRTNTSYFAVLKNEKIVVANDENLADSKKQLDMVKEFMNVGKKTLADVYRQDVQVAQNELALERSKNELKKSKVDLLFAINTDINKEYVISEASVNTNLSDADLKTILDRNSNTAVLTSAALQNRIDYKSTQQSVRISQVQLNIDRKNLFFPSLSGFANYNLNASRISNIDDSRTFSFGLTLSYSIFQGMSLSNRSQASEIVIRQRQDDVKQLEKQISSDIKKAYIDLETQYKQIEILNRNIVSAEQDKILSEENYRVGLGTLLDAQTAATKLNSLKIDLINSYYDFLLAEKRIRYYTGDLTY